MKGPHPEFRSLVAHVLGTKLLDAASLAHLERCHHCRSDVRWLEDLNNLRHFEPPSSAVETALGHFKKRLDGAA